MNPKSVRHTLAILLVGIAFAATPLPLGAQDTLGLWSEDPGPLVETIREGIEDYYRFRYDAALRRFDRVEAERPRHPVGSFLKAEAWWWMYLNDRQNREARRSLEANLERTIDRAEAWLEERPDDVEVRFVLGSAYGRRGMLAGTEKSAWGAARDARRAKRHLEKVRELDPDNADALAAEGLYKYYVGTFGSVVRTASRLLFGLQGDRKQGIEALDRARRSGTYTRTEAAFFQSLFFLQFEDRPAAAQPILDRLRERYPQNLYFTTMAAYARQRRNRYEAAERLYSGILSRLAETPAYGREGESITRLFYGQTLLAAGKLDPAWRQFVRVVQLRAEETEAYPHAYLYLGRLADLRREREIARRYYRKVLSLPDAADSHEAAERHLETPFTLDEVRPLVSGPAR